MFKYSCKSLVGWYQMQDIFMQKTSVETSVKTDTFACSRHFPYFQLETNSFSIFADSPWADISNAVAMYVPYANWLFECLHYPVERHESNRPIRGGR